MAGVGGGGGGFGGAFAAVAKGEQPAVGSAVSEGGAPDVQDWIVTNACSFSDLSYF